MIAELGHAALWLAAAFALLQLVAGSSRGGLRSLAAPAAYSQALLAVAALAALIAAFQSVDLSVEAVIAAADRRLPPLFRLTASWSSPAGTLLLTLTALALGGVGLALSEVPPRRLAALGAAGLTLAAVLLWLDPFARAVPSPTAGNGLSPALQVPVLVAATPLFAGGVAALTVAAVLGRCPAGQRAAFTAAALLAGSASTEAWAAWYARGSLDGAPLGAGWLSLAALIATLGLAPLRPLAATLVALGAACVAAALADGATVGSGVLGPGGTAVIAGHRLRLVGLTPAAGLNWTAVAATITVDAATVRPERRDYVVPPASVSRAATTGDVAVALIDITPPYVRVRVEARRLKSWLWVGAAAVIAGAVLGALRWRR